MTSGTTSCIDHVYSNFDTGSIDNHIVLADVSDHFGTLSKIEGVTWETEQQNCFYRKSNLSDEKWEDFNCDFQESLKANIPSPPSA